MSLSEDFDLGNRVWNHYRNIGHSILVRISSDELDFYGSKASVTVH